ncbi:MAG: hypothetical protein LBK62_03165 [Treponema sp.]|jgi:hypothetical protein|nr:hypothetical protein [Treponema sp.]
MKLKFFILFLILVLTPIFAEPLHSPTWGFRLDLPDGYELAEGNGRDRFSFAGPGRVRFDLAVYSGVYRTTKNLVDDISRRLGNRGDVSFFEYRDKSAALIELRFGDSSGWGLCVELGAINTGIPPMLLALSYGPAGKNDMELFHISALDSIAPSKAEWRCPGPITEFGYPRGKEKRIALALPGLTALIRENDAQAAQALVDREFALLRRYLSSKNPQKAWIRFYRAIFRDSWDRLADAVFQLERKWNVSTTEAAGQNSVPADNMDGSLTETALGNRVLAEKALAWVQTFAYERDLMGSDFVNLVSAVTEGRGDCDSRAMLWAMILAQADIPAAIMVSSEHKHAMGLADVAGAGARFEHEGTKWLVAETTAKVNLGLIDRDVSNINSWLGVTFR